MKRWNITLPDELSSELRSISNKSRFLAEALSEKLEKKRREQMDRLLAEGYQVTKKEDRNINQGWEAIALRGW